MPADTASPIQTVAASIAESPIQTIPVCSELSIFLTLKDEDNRSNRRSLRLNLRIRDAPPTSAAADTPESFGMLLLVVFSHITLHASYRGSQLLDVKFLDNGGASSVRYPLLNHVS
jgi:hypothetical protein